MTSTGIVTTSTYSWVPCSTSVGTNGNSVIYSTYLTPTYYPTTYTTTIVTYPTITPQPPVQTYSSAPQPPVVTPSVSIPAVSTQCPAVATVTVTVQPQPCKACETKTYTITENGSKTTFTVTVTPTYTPLPISSDISSKPPHPTGGSSIYITPSGTGSIPYPTHSSAPSSSVYSTGRVGPTPNKRTPGGTRMLRLSL